MLLAAIQKSPIKIVKPPPAPAFHWPVHWAALLPTLVTAVGICLVLAVASWLVTRWLGHIGNADGATPERAALVHQVGRTVRHMASAIGVLLVLLVLIRGLGIGVPQLTWQALSGWLATRGVRLLVIVAAAYLVIRIIDYLVAHLQSILLAGADGDSRDRVERRKRVQTVGNLIRGVTIGVVAGMALLMGLRQLDVDITPVLTGAGVLGVAIGFGSQTMVKDVLSGLFLILENQMRVGDMITINGETGVLESLRLRITVLRGQDGTVYVFQNGSISQYANLTKDYSYAMLTLNVAAKEDLEHVRRVLEAMGKELHDDPAFKDKILGPLEVLGVQSVGSAGAQITARMRTLPMEQWKIASELRKRAQQYFAKENIALA